MNNKRKKIIRNVIILLLIIGAFGGWSFYNKSKNKPEIQTAVAEMSDIIESVSADGVISPVTTVEIKSNIGGTIVKLYVDEGDYVKEGQLIAQIDPADVLTTLEKEQNNVSSAQAKLKSSQYSIEIQRKQAESDIISAREQLKSEKVKLDQARKLAKIQPSLTSSQLQNAENSLKSAEASLEQLKTATSRQKLTAAKTAYDSSKATYEQVSKDLERNKSLLDKGYISQKDYDALYDKYISAKAAYENAESKYGTIKDETDADIYIAQTKVNQAMADLQEAEANKAQIDIKNSDVTASEAAVKRAEATLASALVAARNIDVKVADYQQAKASLSSAESSLENAKTNYGYTNITAPRSGVVVAKYAEEGSIIMAGRSTNAGSASGVVIVELADITKMEALVDVDETDIAQIRIGQKVNVTVDAYSEKKYTGIVTKIAPKATSESNVTTIPVTVSIDQSDINLKPDMKASCEFIIKEKKNILTVPSSFVKGGKTGKVVFKMVGGKPKPIPVEIGILGDDNVEILSGIKAGEEICLPPDTEEEQGSSNQNGRNGNGNRGGNRPGGGRPGGMRGMPPP